jgi:hypothetical protein
VIVYKGRHSEKDEDKNEGKTLKVGELVVLIIFAGYRLQGMRRRGAMSHKAIGPAAGIIPPATDWAMG